VNRSDITKEARSWKGTRWQHQASLKNCACDCIGLVRGVYRVLTKVDVNTEINYPATWHLYNAEPWLYNECKKHMTEIRIEQAGEGDILLFKMRPRFVAHHCGFLTADKTLIHAYANVGKVVEVTYDVNWQKWTSNVFRFLEVT
jgi:NlpC/P60 family putative phage cell wall peptidase